MLGPTAHADSCALFSTVKAVRELLQTKLATGEADAAREELQTSLEEIQVLWEELRAQAEDLARERQRYAEFFEYAPDAYLMTDADGNIREANRAAAELFGVSQSSLGGRPLTIYVPEQERREFRRNLLQAGASAEEEMREWHGKIKIAYGEEFSARFCVRHSSAPTICERPPSYLSGRRTQNKRAFGFASSVSRCLVKLSHLGFELLGDDAQLFERRGNVRGAPGVCR